MRLRREGTRTVSRHSALLVGLVFLFLFSQGQKHATYLYGGPEREVKFLSLMINIDKQPCALPGEERRLVLRISVLVLANLLLWGRLSARGKAISPPPSLPFAPSQLSLHPSASPSPPPNLPPQGGGVAGEGLSGRSGQGGVAGEGLSGRSGQGGVLGEEQPAGSGDGGAAGDAREVQGS